MRTGLPILLLQAGLMLGVPLLAFAPRRDGPHLVVPLAGGDPGRMAAALGGAGARLVGTGPLPGSLFLWGDGWRLARRALGRGAIVMSAAPPGCSRAEERQ